MGTLCSLHTTGLELPWTWRWLSVRVGSLALADLLCSQERNRVCKADLQSRHQAGQRTRGGESAWAYGVQNLGSEGREVPRRGQRCARHARAPSRGRERRASRQGHKTTRVKAPDGKERATLRAGFCPPHLSPVKSRIKCSAEPRLHPSQSRGARPPGPREWDPRGCSRAGGRRFRAQQGGTPES